MSASADSDALAELQRDFQRHVMQGHEGIVAAIASTSEVPAALRLSIYSDAYRLRLTEALASALPRLQELIGEQRFAELAREYIDLHPSSFASIRWFGEQLPLLLQQSHPEQPWLAELASWEWAVAAAFDGPDAESIGIDALAAIAPEHWPSLTFEFHPTLAVLAMRTNAPVLFKTLSADDSPPEAVTLEEPQSWLIWRQGLKTQYRSLTADEAAALAVMRDGGSFEMLCDTLCAWHDAEAVPAQAAGLLKRWVVEQMIVGVS